MKTYAPLALAALLVAGCGPSGGGNAGADDLPAVSGAPLPTLAPVLLPPAVTPSPLPTATVAPLQPATPNPLPT